jgi:DNA polymerase III, delta subunit
MIGHKKNLENLKGLADAGTLGHGYIFFGPAMVGKKMAALAFAKYLETSIGGAADHPHATLSDMTVIEPGENNSIGIDAAREAKHFLWQKPTVSVRRTLIIDDADLMTTEAQNALLKVAEEPPASSLLILVTSDIESIIPTITSRLPKIYFGTVAQKEIEKWLMDTANEDERAADALAKSIEEAEAGKKKPKAAKEAKAPKVAKAKSKKTEEKGLAKMTGAQASALAAKSFGKPGLAWRLTHDPTFAEQLDFAEQLLKVSPATRRDLIKKIIDPDDFNFRKFLDAVIMILAWQGKTKQNATLWHKALALYARETDFSLNPRLQLEALLF